MKLFETKKQSTNLYTNLNVYFCSKNPMYEPFLCGCYGNLNRICIATTNELLEKNMFFFKRVKGFVWYGRAIGPNRFDFNISVVLINCINILKFKNNDTSRYK